MITTPAAPHAPQPAHRGQTLVIFALASLVLLGALGLALDGGMLLSKRRTMQNAADAAALAGATALKGNNGNGFFVRSTVRAVAQQNGVADPTDAAQLTCTYLNNNLQPLASPRTNCDDAPFPTGTAVSAVQVTVHETHPTFVMRALGIASSGTGATATAQIQLLTTLPNALVPFLPCGIDTKTVAANGNVNGTRSILLPASGKTLKYGDDPTKSTYQDGVAAYYPAAWQGANGQVAIDPSAFSYDMFVNPPGTGAAASPNPYRFLIHAPSGNTATGIERCSADGYAAWKGYNARLTGDIDIDGTLRLQGDHDYTPAGYPGAVGPTENDVVYATGKGGPVEAGVGERAGPANSVPGAGGCAAGQDSNCIMLLPILDNAVRSGNGSGGILAARTFAAFYITKTANGNEHYGALVKNWTPHMQGKPTFTSGATGVTSIRLIH